MKHIYEPNVEMTTRDGIKLMADVWYPAEGKAPALLLRTPYGKQMVAEGVNTGGLTPVLLALINAGYAVMVQDTRGTGKSEGHFEPKLAEIADGQDTIAWLCEQSWSDGTVGMYGGSYMGMVQWAAAISETPSLRAIIPAIASTDWYSDLWYSQGGAMSLSLNTQWNAMVYSMQEQRALEAGDSQDPTALQRLGAAALDPLSLNDATPLAELPVHGTGRWFDDWIAHPNFDEYWSDQDWS